MCIPKTQFSLLRCHGATVSTSIRSMHGMTFIDFDDSADLDSIRLLGDALRGVQDRVAATGAPSSIAAEAALLLDQASALLDPFRYQAAIDKSWDDVKRSPGSRTLNPRMTDVVWSEERLHAKVTFTSFYLGGNGAVHGGAIPCLFDQILGQVANHGRPICRTAYLNVDYRSVTLIDHELRVEAYLESIDGRKRFAYAALYDGDILTAEAHGLFIELREGAA